jgi:hypothetical protein
MGACDGLELLFGAALVWMGLEGRALVGLFESLFGESNFFFEFEDFETTLEIVEGLFIPTAFCYRGGCTLGLDLVV